LRRWNIAKKKVLLDLNPELTEIWEKQIKEIAPLEDDFEKMMERFFTKQKNEVVRNIKLEEKSLAEKLAINLISHGKIHLQAEGVIFDINKWEQELIESSSPLLKETIRQTAQDVVSEFSTGAIDMSMPSVRNEIGRRAAQMSTFVNGTTNKEIKSLLEDAEARRLSISQKADLIGKKFDEISPARAKTIARTETMGAANHGTLEGIRQAKVDGKQWITSRDERVRFDHLIDGQIKKVDEDFVLNNGSQVPYPMAINERCVLSPHKVNVEQEINKPTQASNPPSLLNKPTTKFREFTDFPSMKALNKSKGIEWSNSIEGDTAMRDSFTWYKRSGYKDINSQLRTAWTDARDDILNMDRDFNININQDIKLFRGVRPGNTGEIFRSIEDGTIVGTNIGDLGFSSTTLSREFSEAWLRTGPGGVVEEGLIFEINTPAATPVAFLDEGVGTGLREYEVLLKRGSKFKVKKAWIDDLDVGHLELDLIP